MQDPIISLKESLKEIDTQKSMISEAEVAHAIAKLKNEIGLEDFPFEYIAELMAFNADERDISQPEFKGQTIFTIRSKSEITAEIIDYWNERIKQSSHPVFIARYALLVWDQNKIVKKEKPNYELAQIALDAIVNTANMNLYRYKMIMISRLRIALQVAIIINDQDRIIKIRDSIINYETLISKEDQPGTWGFTFDTFWENKKIKLDDSQWEKIIISLENHLKLTADMGIPNSFNPHAAEAAASRLAQFYSKKNLKDEVRRVLLLSSKVYEIAEQKVSPLVAMEWMKHTHDVFNDFNLKQEAEDILKKIAAIGPKASAELKRFETKIEIPKEKISKAIEIFFKDNLINALSKIALFFIPSKVQIEKQFELIGKLSPLSLSISTKLMDRKGRILSVVGPLDDDLTGNICLQISENMRYMGLYLHIIIDAMKKKYGESENTYTDFLFQSPVFPAESRPFIEYGLKEYFHGNHLVAIHLLIPQIECIIRNLIQIAGGSILKQGPQGRLDEKLLHELLMDPILIQIFGEIGDEIINYFKTFLTDVRGWNIRNSVCHGLLNYDSFAPAVSDRLFHVLLCLSLIREKQIVPEKPK